VVQNILIGYARNKGSSTLQFYEGKLDGPLFQLPGGDVRAAVGYEGQRFTVQQTNFQGTISTPTGLTRFFARTVNSYYGELLIPIFGTANAMPGLQKLTVDIAGRIDDYSDVGSTRNPKIGVSWSPIQDLSLRATYGTSFRAPTISQIYGNTNTLFVQNYSDPTCGCIRQGVTRSGGNLNLRPETAKTWSVGADYQPSWLPRSKFSLTYFDIDYQNQVTSFLADLTILNRESQFAGTGLIVRNPSPALIAQQLAETGFTGVLPNPVTLFVEGRNLNLGTTIAKGLDFLTSYRFPTTAWGDFGLGLNGTYLTEYRVALTPAAPLINRNNTIFNPLRFKARGSVSWETGNWSSVVFLNYLNSYTNDLSTPVQKVRAYKPIDLHVSYSVRDYSMAPWLNGVRFGVDIRNAFDEKPPFVNIAQSANGGGGFDPTLASPVGRLIAVSVDKRF
jgi:iron complex outermembrane receptor protein